MYREREVKEGELEKMVRSPSVDKNGLKRGTWSEEEDKKLKDYVQRYGHWNWRQLPRFAGLARCGKSCRLRYLNYLRPGLKKGAYSTEEEEMIIKLRQEHGNKWSTIASKLPGRTDNEIKNYWNSNLKKRMQMQQDLKSKGKTNGRSQKIQVTDQKEQDSSVSISGSTDWKPETDHHADTDTDTATQEISSSKSYDYSGGQENYSFSSEESVFPKFFESFWTEPFFPSTPNRQISTPTSYNNNNDSRVLDLDLEDWIAENELMSFEIEEEQSLVNYFRGLSTDAIPDALISPSTSSSSTNSSISCTNSSIQPFLSDLSSSSSSINDLISTSSANYNSTVVMNSQESSSADAFGGFWSTDEPTFSSDFTSLPPVEEGIVFPFSNNNSSLEYYDIYDLFNQF